MGRELGSWTAPQQQRRQLLHARRSRPLHRRRRDGRTCRRRGGVARRRRGHRDLHPGDRRGRQEPHLAVSVRARPQPRSQPPQGRVPSRQPPDRLDHRRFSRSSRHGDDGVRVPDRARRRVRRARRRQPRVRAAQRRAAADHQRPLVGRRAGARRDDDRRSRRASTPGGTS